MEIHLHLAAAYAREPWVEHFEWLEPMFNERLEIRNGRMIVPNRPGLGFSLSEQATAWTVECGSASKLRPWPHYTYRIDSSCKSASRGGPPSAPMEGHPESSISSKNRYCPGTP
jgi:hypothetical protein